jgi:hypothetical protein
VRCPYRFVIEVRPPDGLPTQQVTIEPDWEPALEAARFAGLRSLGVWSQPDSARAHIEPRWFAGAGPPRVRSLSVHVNSDGHHWSVDLPAVRYFHEAARAVIARLVADGRITAGQRVGYAVTAYAIDGPFAKTSALTFETADRLQPCPARDRPIGELVDRSIACGESDPSDIDVVLPELMLDEICELTLDAGEAETGGVLVGHLCRNHASRDFGLELTAQVPARHTEANASKLTFTADTWTDVRAAVALRQAGELLVGYWHSHPAHGWCKACPVERQTACPLSAGFLSADDKALHRVMFPAAYSQALVITRSVRGLDVQLFGWRHGVLEPRGFRLLPADVPRPRAREAVRLAPLVTGEACAGRGEPERDAETVSTSLSRPGAGA